LSILFYGLSRKFAIYIYQKDVFIIQDYNIRNIKETKKRERERKIVSTFKFLVLFIDISIVILTLFRLISIRVL